MSVMLILKATAGELEGQEFAFNGPAYCVLGRSKSCSLRLPGDGTVSRQHCLVELDRDGVWVQDLGSLNGTHINGEKIGQRGAAPEADVTMVQPPRQRLHNGDTLRICNNAFSVRLVTEAKATPREKKGSWELALCV